MTSKPLAVSLAFTLLLGAGFAQAGGPKPEHPCYTVADCKSKGSQKEFSACVAENKAEADANAECASFRKDKDAWMKERGVSDLRALFES